jgi:hypothetical protein
MSVSHYPAVFKEAKSILGGQYLLSYLQDKFKPSRRGRIYELIARWPVPVFLTTNYDDEIQRHLSKLGESYVPYSNREDHLSYLLPDLKGAIYKLHGDLRSEEGLIIDSVQYTEIQNSERWLYWRTKMTSVFQMNRVVVIGHSLNDPNIIHLLEAAKRGAGVLQPICWIAPDIKPELSREYLEKYRIRVIPYNNSDGDHRNMFRLIENISDFIPPRTSIHIQSKIAQMSHSPLGSNAAAPGFFVFNNLIIQEDFEQKRIGVLISALLSTLPQLSSLVDFTLREALEMAGWPKSLDLEIGFKKRLSEEFIRAGILLSSGGDKFKIGDNAERLASGNKGKFIHMQERFKKSLILRIRRNYANIPEPEATSIANDIEASLTGYFRDGGLSLISTLFIEKGKQPPAPPSIIKFITEASARYNDLLKRQAFCTISVDIFVHREEAEREYLGRVAQGFLGFHSLGVFGGAAIERLKNAKETVWLMDSDSQIPALALASPSNNAFRTCFLRLREARIRLFTTQKLFDETREHLWFAQRVISENGARSRLIIAAATGQAPFRKSNRFLEGFINWQVAGNPCDWNRYLAEIFDNPNPGFKDMESALNRLGIEVIPLQDWPGFSSSDYAEIEGAIKEITGKYESAVSRDIDPMSDAQEKAGPEGQALIIISKERSGKYYMLAKGNSPAWFISHTSLLNLIQPNLKITWQPEAFLKFTSTLALGTDEETADRAFETILWGVAQSGLSLLDEETAAQICGGTIDQETLDIGELQKIYADTIGKKYGEPLEEVLKRVPPVDRSLAVVQLMNEIIQTQTEKLRSAESRVSEASKRLSETEKKLKEVELFRRKMEMKREKGRRKTKKRKLAKRRKRISKKKK